MAEFIKAGNRVFNKPKGIDYELVPGQVYVLKFDRYGAGSYFEEDGKLNLDFKIYNTDEEVRFMDKVLKYHKTSSKRSTGVMLSGVKGTGKTVMSKLIANKSGLPIVVVDPEYPSNQIENFFTKFKTETVIIFDEVEKHWSTTNLLGFLDGVQETAKKLVLFTCNDVSKTSEYLKDRCSRIRYRRDFKAEENARFIKSIIADKGLTDPDDKLYNFIVDNFETLSIDNVLSFLDEKLAYPEDTNEELILDMNIDVKNVNNLKNKQSEKSVTEITECTKYESENCEDSCEGDEFYKELDLEELCLN